MLKKLFVVSVVLSSLFVVSCGKDEIDGQDKWLTSLDQGREAAQDSEKNIFLLVTADEDGYSAGVKNDVFFRHSFVEKYSKDYVFVNFDFTSSFIQKAFEEGSEDAEMMAQYDANMSQAMLYGINMTPSFYVLSKEGFVAAQIFLNSDTTSVKAFNSLFDESRKQIENFNSLLQKSYGTEDNGIIDAVNALAENTYPDFLHILKPLLEDYLRIDADNKTSRCGTYLLACCNYDARRLLFTQDYTGAADIFENAALKTYLTDEEKQSLYYQAGFLLASCGYMDYERIKGLFQEALDAAPESQYADGIKVMINSVEERIKNGDAIGF